MANDYTDVITQPYTYLDNTNQVVDGFKVFFTITDFDENHFVLVPNLNPAIVTKAIKALVTDRKSIST